MGLNFTHFQYFTLFLFVFTLNISTVCEAQSAQNVTIGYQDSSIIYSPPGAWSTSAPNDLDFDGAHMLAEQNPDATASFTFTGVAIYFISPLWPYVVNTAVSIDSGPMTLIDLQDHTRPNVGQGAETVAASVVWGANGLTNTSHKLLISVGANQPYAVVDGLIYTTVTEVSSSTSSSLSTTSTLSTSSVASSSTAASASATPSLISNSKSRLAIPLGSVFGALGLFAILGGVWYLFRRRNKRPNSEASTIDGSATMTNPSMSPVGPDRKESWSPEYLYKNGHLMNQSNDRKSWHNEMLPPPLPSQPYNRGYQNDISSHTAVNQDVTEARMLNPYDPVGGVLSTITEGSTPQTGEGRTPLGNSPASYQTNLVYYKTQGSEGYNVFQEQ